MSAHSKEKIHDSPFPLDYLKYHFGNLDLLVINDGNVQYEDSCFAPDVAHSRLEEVKKKYGNELPYFLLPHNILIIKSRNQIVMIDSGNGSKAGKNAGKLKENLKLAGIKAADLTDVVLSHAHPDHFNGLINDDGKLAFPNAMIHMHRAEFDFWEDNDADFSKSRNSEKFLRLLQHEIKTFFSRIKSKLRLFDHGEQLFDFLQPILTPGHTPGHCMFTIISDSEKFIHISDIFHDDIVLFDKPEWGTIFDTDFELAVSTREKVLKKFAASEERLFGYHLPWPGFGYIHKDNYRYSWVSESI